MIHNIINPTWRPTGTPEPEPPVGHRPVRTILFFWNRIMKLKED